MVNSDSTVWGGLGGDLAGGVTDMAGHSLCFLLEVQEVISQLAALAALPCLGGDGFLSFWNYRPNKPFCL